MSQANWLRVDEATDVLGSIRHSLRCADDLGSDQLTWKWLMLSLHAALQGACACHLTTTAQPVGCLTKQSTKQWLAYLNGNFEGNRPETRMAALPELLRRVRKPNSAGDRSDRHRVRITDAELQGLSHFHREIRNQFVHFVPLGWTIELSDMPSLVRIIARIVEDVRVAGWGFRHLSQGENDELRLNLAGLGKFDK